MTLHVPSIARHILSSNGCQSLRSDQMSCSYCGPIALHRTWRFLGYGPEGGDWTSEFRRDRRPERAGLRPAERVVAPGRGGEGGGPLVPGGEGGGLRALRMSPTRRAGYTFAQPRRTNRNSDVEPVVSHPPARPRHPSALEPMSPLLAQPPHSREKDTSRAQPVRQHLASTINQSSVACAARRSHTDMRIVPMHRLPCAGTEWPT